MTPIVIVPGWRDSGPDHWQSLWANQLPGAVRVQQEDWLSPKCTAWVDSISRAILAQPDPVVVVAHSLGCIATVHLPAQVALHVRAALLVAPADPARRAALADFSPVPWQPLPYPNIVVASGNDPYCPVRTSGAFARSWGSEFVRLQSAGHINAESDLGVWPLGLSLLGYLAGEHYDVVPTTLASPRCAANPMPAAIASR